MQKTLLLITDISGFTRFIAESEPEVGIAHAREMLEIILHSNSLGLELCEIEGDAVFFYLKKGFPSHDRFLNQVKSTYAIFQAYLAQHGLESRLGIKFFVHSGYCGELVIGGKKKLFGLDVIKIHRLLKGLVHQRNYLLITHEAADMLQFLPDPSTQCGAVDYEHIGIMNYYVLSADILTQPVVPVPQSRTHVIKGLSGLVAWAGMQFVRGFVHFALQLRNAAI